MTVRSDRIYAFFRPVAWPPNPRTRPDDPIRRIGSLPTLANDPGWRRISWEEALSETVARLTEIKQAHGPAAVAFSSVSPSTSAISDCLDYIQRLRREMGKGGGYFLAPAKPMLTETPTENAVALVEEFLG